MEKPLLETPPNGNSVRLRAGPKIEERCWNEGCGASLGGFSEVVEKFCDKYWKVLYWYFFIVVILGKGKNIHPCVPLHHSEFFCRHIMGDHTLETRRFMLYIWTHTQKAACAYNILRMSAYAYLKLAHLCV